MGTGAYGIFFLWQTKENNILNSEFQAFLGFFLELIHRQSKDPGHGRDLLPFVFPRHDKERIDELSGRELSLADKGSESLIFPHPTWAIFRKNHDMNSLEKRFRKSERCMPSVVQGGMVDG
jgi:hypothetical protein